MSFHLHAGGDSVRVSKNEILILEDTILAPERDTVYFLDDQKYKLRSNPYKSSSDFYQKMREKTGQYKITAELFDLLYVSKGAASEHVPSKNNRTSNAPFMPYEGMRIRSIRIKHLDILEGNVNDTLLQASSRVGKLTNQVHMNTWNSVIRSNLLIEANEEIDPYVLADNERVIRRLRFVEDVRIYVKPEPNQSYAEIVVVVKDRFAWGMYLRTQGTNQFDLELYNRNIGGWGKYASTTWFYNASTMPSSGYDIRLGGQNIDNTITNWELDHTNNSNTKSWGLNIQKEFVAPGVKYGGGLEVRSISDSTLYLDGEASRSLYHHLNFQDLWVGRSLLLPSSQGRNNLVLSTRYLRHAFTERPQVSADSNFLYFNRSLLLGAVSFSSMKFLKSNYITSFGISEDIPLGYQLSLVTGRDFNEFFHQNYYGFQFFSSVYLKDLGYILLTQQAGGFDNSGLQNGIFRTRVDYFSPLLTADRYHIRNFFRASFAQGMQQPGYKSISLESRIRDLEGDQISGNSIMVVGVESVLFTPWYLYGFRFAPFFYYNVGEAWDTRPGQGVSHGYQGMGGGIRIRNESLVFNTLEMRISYFPKRPLNGPRMTFSLSSTIPIAFDNIFRYKPALVPYR